MGTSTILRITGVGDRVDSEWVTHVLVLEIPTAVEWPGDRRSQVASSHSVLA